jgi:HNH endonuclease
MHDDIELVRDFSRRMFHTHCWYCGMEIKKCKLRKGLKNKDSHAYWSSKTQDHIVAESKGGGKRENLLPSCMRCNTQKGSLDVKEFRIVFFGIHGGLFWGEQLALRVKAIKAGKKVETELHEIPLNKTTGCVEQYEVNRNRAKQKPQEKEDKAFFERLWL